MLVKIIKSTKKITVILLMITVLAVVFFISQEALAQSIELQSLGSTGLGTQSLVVTVAKIIQIFLGFLGVIALGLILYAGFIWMTSGGNQEKVAQAKKILINAAIGLLIILASYAIVTFLIQKIILSTGGGPGGPGGPSGPPGPVLGGGIIESVYPAPNSTNNPRNTLIMVTFKEQVTEIIDNSDPGFQSTYCSGLSNMLCGKLAITGSNPNVQIINNSNVGNYPGTFLPADQVVVMTNENPASPISNYKSFVFDPILELGSLAEPTNYTIKLSSNILKVNSGMPALPNGFNWSFGIGTFSDNIPPYVVSVFPVAGATVAKNALVQINFSEAVNAVSATGITLSGGGGFNNITVIDSALQVVPGEYAISNQYKTVEFLSSLDCGTGQLLNSCGNSVYCLPANENLTATIKADTIPLITFIGISDAAGNSLDGNFNGIAEGSGVDDYIWNFLTNNQLDLNPPILISLDPDNAESNIPLNITIKGTFNEDISAASVNTTNYILIEDDPACTDFGIAEPDQYGQYPNIPNWCWPGGYGVGVENGNEAKLWTYSNLESLISYNPRLLSYIQDMFQNCFYPSTGP